MSFHCYADDVQIFLPLQMNCTNSTFIMGANAEGKAHILLLLILIILPLPPRFSARNSSRSDGLTGIKNTSLRARRSAEVCYDFSLSLLERNSGKLRKTGKNPNGKMHGKGQKFGGLLTQPYSITDTSFKVCMWQERLSFNFGKGLVDRLYSFDTTAVYVLCGQ